MRAPLTAQLANLLFAGCLCFGCVKEVAQGPRSEGPLGAQPGARAQTAKQAPVEAVLSFSEPPSRGPQNAPIVIETYGDFECSYCARGAVVLRKLEQLYPRDVRVVWRNFPLEFHARAQPAANAMFSAYEQGGHLAFWRMHDLLFAVQMRSGEAKLEDAELGAYATQLGLDAKLVERAINENRYAARISKDIERGRVSGVRATPTFVINGFVIEGLVPLEVLQHAVEALLRQRQERLQHAI